MTKMQIVEYLKKHSYLPKEGIERFAKIYAGQLSATAIREKMKENGCQWYLTIDPSFRRDEEKQLSIEFEDY